MLNQFKGVLLLVFSNNKVKLKKKENKMSISGKVKWFNGTKGYGFIERDDKEKDVFVHSSAAQAANMELNEGDALTFEVENGEKGPSAVNLQKA
jgi:CspA family cold shock protein